MRWKKPVQGDIKVKSFFALWPVSIYDETRWLERVTVKYSYESNGFRFRWIARDFINK